jgi:seryl-tRNA synthetase
MHDIRLIRDDPAAFDDGLRKRGLPPLSANLLWLDDARKIAITASQEAQERRNALSREIGAAKKARDEASAHQLMAEVAGLKEAAPALEQAEKAASDALREMLMSVPNLPAADVPVGSDEAGNVVRHEWGRPAVIRAACCGSTSSRNASSSRSRRRRFQPRSTSGCWPPRKRSCRSWTSPIA